MPEEVKQDRQHHQGNAHCQHPGHQRPSPIEHQHQIIGQTGPKHAWMPISREPPKIGPQHRLKDADTAIVPTNRRALGSRSVEFLLIRRRDPAIITHIHHERRTIPASHETVWSMTYTIGPPKPKRLRHNANHVRVSIQRHQLIAFQPRLMTNMNTGTGKPPQTRKIALTTIRRKIPHR